MRWFGRLTNSRRHSDRRERRRGVSCLADVAWTEYGAKAPDRATFAAAADRARPRATRHRVPRTTHVQTRQRRAAAIEGAANTSSSRFQDVSIDHGGPDVAMPEQLLISAASCTREAHRGAGGPNPPLGPARRSLRRPWAPGGRGRPGRRRGGAAADGEGPPPRTPCRVAAAGVSTRSTRERARVEGRPPEGRHDRASGAGRRRTMRPGRQLPT